MTDPTNTINLSVTFQPFFKGEKGDKGDTGDVTPAAEAARDGAVEAQAAAASAAASAIAITTGEAQVLINGSSVQAVFVGDSLTNGLTSPNTTAYPTYLKQLYPGLSNSPLTNVGVPGSTFAQMNTRYATEAYPKRPAATGSVKSLLFVWIGANDFAALPDPATYIASLEAYWSQAKTDGFTVIAFTIMERNNANDLQYAKRNCRAQINSLIRASKVWDALVDVDGLFPPGSQADTSLFIDGTHLTDAGNKKLAKHVAAIVSQNSNPLPLAPGPTSFVPVVTSSMKAVLDRASFTVKANTTLSLANAIAAIGTGDYTIEWWAYNPTGGADGTNSVLNKSGGSGFGYFSTASATAEGKLFVLPGGSTNWSAARLLSGYYNHNVIKRSGTTVSFYINNILVRTAADTNTHTALNQMVLTVGKYARLRAYSRALSDAEVEAKYGNLSVFDSAESSYLFAISDGSDNLGTQIQDLSASRAHINLGANAVLTMPGPVGQFKFRTVGNAAVANAPTGVRLVSYTLNVSVAGGGSVNSGDTNGGGDYQNAALTTGLKVGVMTNPFPASGTIFINAAGYTIDHTMVFHKL